MSTFLWYSSQNALVRNRTPLRINVLPTRSSVVVNVRRDYSPGGQTNGAVFITQQGSLKMTELQWHFIYPRWMPRSNSRSGEKQRIFSALVHCCIIDLLQFVIYVLSFRSEFRHCGVNIYETTHKTCCDLKHSAKLHIDVSFISSYVVI